MPEHEAIAEAIERKDSEAARETMRTHLGTVAGYLEDELALSA